jgi:hypothetical protein
MVSIVGYSYDAAVHCPACTTVDFINGTIRPKQSCHECVLDAQALPEEMFDREQNPVHPIFSTDEHDEATEHCDTCRADLRA